jgi:ubiquinone biosynthesis accessory factor UbiJ
MPATAPWLASAEAVFNRSIAASSQASALARRLEGTHLQLEIEGITRIRCGVFGGSLVLAAPDAAAPDAAAPDAAAPDAAAADAAAAEAVISGSAPALLQLLKAGSPQVQGQVPVQIRGDAEIANLYRQLFAAARPDLEEELSRWIGDMPARRLSQMAKSVRTWARRARRTAGENIAEYLQEESRDLISKTELDEFLRGVDEVREAADRIAARLGRLEQLARGAS